MDKIISLVISCVFTAAIFIAGNAMANGTISQPYPVNNTSYKSCSAVIIPGSLRNNIQRIAKQCGWNKIVWKIDRDYHWIGHTTISGNNLEDVMRKLLEDYPLQAIFYKGNHILVIQARTLT